jgi:hypothetical protein
MKEKSELIVNIVAGFSPLAAFLLPIPFAYQLLGFFGLFAIWIVYSLDAPDPE